MKHSQNDLKIALSALLAERAVIRKRAREIAIKAKRIRAALDRSQPLAGGDTPQGSTITPPDDLDTLIDAFLND